MVCPHCGEGALGAEMRFCPACGTELSRLPTAVTGNVVGDGSERAMSALVGRTVLEWTMSNKGRLALYAAGAALAVAAFVVAVLTILTAAAALAPVIIVIAVVSLASRRHRHRRWRRRWIRY